MKLIRALTALLLTLAATLAAIAAAPASATVGTTKTAASSTAEAAAPSFTIGTHNVYNGDAKFTEFADVIGWQEVYQKPDWAKLKRSLPGYTTYFAKPAPAKEDAISWRSSRFIEVDHGYSKTHGGEKHVTPARYVTWVVLKDNKTGKRFAFVNTHFISAAWTGHPERQARWKKHAKVLQDVVSDLRKRGLPVMVTGDFNRYKTVALTQTTFVPVKGSSKVPLDQIYVSKGVRHSKSVKLAKNGSDHYAYRVTVRL